MTVTLPRTNDLPLSFEGRLVAEVTSHTPGKERWTDLRLWQLADDSYVVESVGMSTLPGERALHSAQHCASVGDVIASLRKSDNSRGTRRSYLPDIAWQLLRAAHSAGAIQIPETEAV